MEQGAVLRSFLAEQLSLPIRQIKRFLDCNRCQVNGRFERFGSVRLSKGDLVELEVADANRDEPEILYQDAHLIALDKPAGWTSEALSEWAGAALVHRLDRDTSGVLLLAKDPASALHLEEQFRNRTVEKNYLAVVVGVPKETSGQITTHLTVKGRFSGQTIWGSADTGRLAKTAWEVVRAGKGESLLRCVPQTGRTHQIRVHLAEMGHPVVGDGQYGKRGRMPGRHLLHAERLALRHPNTNETITFSSKPPALFECVS